MKSFIKDYLLKVRECAISASPIVAIIYFAQICLGQYMGVHEQIYFVVSVVLLVFGQALFLLGVNSGILTMGELVGSNIHKLKKLPIILLFGLLFGTVATIAEPAVTVLTGQVADITHISTIIFTLFVSVGIGIFVAYALLRIFISFSMKYSFLILYIITFILLIWTPKTFYAIAFDFSGATTGAITVPFILALGMGVNAVLGRSTKDDSYGLIGLASVGPIITTCILGILRNAGLFVSNETTNDNWLNNMPLILQSFFNILVALLPIAFIFLIFNLLFIKLPKSKIKQIFVGLAVTILGLTIFLTGVNLAFGGDFANASGFIGEKITNSDFPWLKYFIIPLGFLLGFAIIYAEPAIKVLGSQIEENTQGKIRKKILIFVLAMSTGVTIALNMSRIVFELPILYFIVPILIIAFAIMPFVPRLFVGIAFDSGGVATGTITAAFAVPFALGACSGLGLTGETNDLIYGFGMIAFICLMPILTICFLGLIYNLKIIKSKKFVPRMVQQTPKIDVSTAVIVIICKPELET
ncbi:MAG: DUF1538 domain-containing protein, partial [Christensenellaceae bacterium]|nr:DUF1538 domain-containing protein [Christensenellaceae bacterium]